MTDTSGHDETRQLFFFRCFKYAFCYIGGLFFPWIGSSENPADRPSSVHGIRAPLRVNDHDPDHDADARELDCPVLAEEKLDQHSYVSLEKLRFSLPGFPFPKSPMLHDGLFVHLCSGEEHVTDLRNYVNHVAVNCGLRVGVLRVDVANDHSLFRPNYPQVRSSCCLCLQTRCCVWSFSGASS